MLLEKVPEELAGGQLRHDVKHPFRGQLMGEGDGDGGRLRRQSRDPTDLLAEMRDGLLVFDGLAREERDGGLAVRGIVVGQVHGAVLVADETLDDPVATERPPDQAHEVRRPGRRLRGLHARGPTAD
jgi:hypothetical protein